MEVKDFREGSLQNNLFRRRVEKLEKGEEMEKKINLKLYVVGETPRSSKALSNLKSIMEKNFKDRYTLEVVDLSEEPQLAEEEKILAVPTVMKSLPRPVQRIVGDLSNEEKVLVGLDLK